MDTIINRISIRATYNELIFDSSIAGFDDIDVSRRSVQRIYFRLTDYCGKADFKKSLLEYVHYISEEGMI